MSLGVRLRTVLLRLARSAGAGGLATLVDLGSLTTMVSLFGVAPRTASVPALVLGSIAMFFGQKHLAFRSRSSRPGEARREIVLFALVQLAGLALNALLYDQVLRAAPLAERWYVVTRMITTNLVWLGFSFPMWHLVFRDRNTSTQSDKGPAT